MKFLISLVGACALQTLVSAIPAFPGAEGFGANAVGGREGGTVHVVTNLEDKGAGSLRDAVSGKNRIVIFAVGGLISIKERIVVSERVTILGQTAPGDGISVYGNGWSFSNADNTIIRYVRIRMGKVGTGKKDCVGIAEGDNMIFDHLSVTTFSINGPVNNITIQNSIIGQGLETHSAGGLMQSDGGISLFRNLYIDNKTRNPKVKGTNDFTNNVVYNWGGGGGYISGGDSSGSSNVNIIGNFFISGPSTSATAFTRGNADFKGFVDGNLFDSDKDGTLNGVLLSAESANFGGMSIAPTRFDYPAPAKILTAQEALDLALKSVGTSLARDSVDKQLIDEVKSFGKVGELISDENASPMSGPGTIAPGTVAVDTDGDGIPDAEETKLGTDPNVADSMTIAANGYTNLENWANSLVPES
ncbi:hypothetical protein HYALB_00003655 [Hymenoscyphus albidus]|uniref:Pectate lyase C n=1 Tax=Hymenoscyphus albidus TaxID=595503 RepID=A0A9N9LYK0_9HELO|nr:hypothetical protein HYALB_00003655 [Hymenoscyphus albidus]